jgi:multidrug resistance efflux pump
MEVLLLGIYAFFVWLIFIKFKWLPWTTPWKVGVAIFPVVAIACLLLLLNIVAPTTSDVRVVNYVVPIVSQVRGRVIEVGVENNRPCQEGRHALQDRSDAVSKRSGLARGQAEI